MIEKEPKAFYYKVGCPHGTIVRATRRAVAGAWNRHKLTCAFQKNNKPQFREHVGTVSEYNLRVKALLGTAQ